MKMTAEPGTTSATPSERLLTGALLVAPLIYLVADSIYAARGWEDATAGVVHVLGAIAYGFVVLRIAAWLPPSSRLTAAILLTGLIGMAGNVAYGFDNRLAAGFALICERSFFFTLASGSICIRSGSRKNISCSTPHRGVR